MPLDPPEPVHSSQLPSALDPALGILRLDTGRLALFFDYDGTLTPIVRHPDMANLDPGIRTLLEEIGARVPVAVLSGRDLDDVAAKVLVPGIWYAGSHGMDLRDPEGDRHTATQANEARPALEAVALELVDGVAGLNGVWVERKRFALAVHVREAPPEIEAVVRDLVHETGRRHPGLRVRGGKKVYELQPDIEWDKGAALRHVAGALGLDLSRDHILYLGDDRTDEDAFAVLDPPSVGIIVRDGIEDAHPTRARYALDGVDEVQRFLERVRDTLTESR